MLRKSEICCANKSIRRNAQLTVSPSSKRKKESRKCSRKGRALVVARMDSESMENLEKRAAFSAGIIFPSTAFVSELTDLSSPHTCIRNHTRTHTHIEAKYH